MKIYVLPSQLPEVRALPEADRRDAVRRNRWKPFGRVSTWLALVASLVILFACRIPILLVSRHHGAELPPLPVMALVALWALVSFAGSMLPFIHVYHANLRPFLSESR